MQDQVFLAGLSDGYDSRKIQFPGKACVQPTLAWYLYLEFSAYFLSGSRGFVYPSLLAAGSGLLGCLFRKFCDEPLQRFELVSQSRSPDLNQKLFQVRADERGILRTLVTDGAHGPKVRWLIASALAFINDMPDMKPGFSRWVIWMRLSGDHTAHLTCKSITVEDVGASFF